MARALVVAIACAMATSATSYGDYAGARMPQYHMDYESRDTAPRDEYPERSPDGHVPLDYKYEEDPDGKHYKAPETIVDENDEWIKTKNRRNKPTDLDHEYSQEVDKYSSTDDRDQKIKSNRIHARNRHNFKRKKVDIDESFPERERRRYDDSKNPSHENLVRLSKDRIVDNKSFERNVKNIGYARGQKRQNRRKTRDKAYPRIDDIEEGILTAEKVFETDDSGEEEVAQITGQRRMMDPERVRVTRPDPDFTTNFAGKRPDKSYADYDEYYDMKRVLNIKNKLPSLLRRTKARYSTTQRTPQVEEWFRRANIPDENKYDTKVSSTTSTAVTTTKSTTKTKVTPKVTTKSPQTTKTTTLKPNVVSSNSSELSLAEKSRLSILKKVQRKESLKSGSGTTKPPVLMQVTERMQTVVMVEPPGSLVERLRARELSNDSPGRVAKAKRLMRHKLLSNAKSIHDLTDNWDDMICEYIDVSLLSKANGVPFNLSYKMALACLLIRSTPETTAGTTSVAERRLDVVLGHRQRKEAPATGPAGPAGPLSTPPTFPPFAIEQAEMKSSTTVNGAVVPLVSGGSQLTTTKDEAVIADIEPSKPEINQGECPSVGMS
ncbi:uncharacterized protein LOC119835682 [Zerene cesonia]|uniref:uncharacterized protein LOC119835682 n=1 Tax=Zerene cesonia TaxID=33412 RepID=UPI0018E530E2|nr:uncharacterized protein LOC119835682 [Zerene cesonia]